MKLFHRKEKPSKEAEKIKRGVLGKEHPKKDDKQKKPKKHHGFSLHFGRRGKEKPKESKPKKPRKKQHMPIRIHLIPSAYENWVEKQLYFSGSGKTPGKMISTIMFVSLIAGGAAWFLFRSLPLVGPGVFIAVFGALNAMLFLSVERRGRFVDEILPDALLLLSANIRAGYIPSRALILSARPEFGPLSMAIRRSGKEIMTGKSLEEGLREIPKRIKSKDLERTIKLIIEGIRGGGKIVTLLEENAVDIRRRQAIRKEIKANIMMYAIFIAFAGCLGAPGLYALSGYLTSTMSKMSPDMTMSSQVSSKVSFMQLGGVSVSEEFLFQFSIAAILVTTIFGGLILGLINSGKERDGLKYAPILVILALLVYFGASFAVGAMFSTMMPS